VVYDCDFDSTDCAAIHDVFVANIQFFLDLSSLVIVPKASCGSCEGLEHDWHCSSDDVPVNSECAFSL